MTRWAKPLQALTVALVLVAGGAVGVATSTAQETSGDVTTAAYNPSRVERQFLDLINRYRASRNEGKLTLSKPLGEAAEKHSRDMARRKKMYHTPQLMQTVRRYGYDGCSVGENVARGYSSAKDVFNAWRRSSGHNRNMISGRYEVIGIAEKNGYWTTIFGDQSRGC